jgi:hypothetical protein
MKAAGRRTIVATTVSLVALTLAAIDARSQPVPDDAVAALGMFDERIGAYAALHRELAQDLPPLVPSHDPLALRAIQSALASAIKAARPTAHEGDIFTPAITRLFRQVIGDAVCGRDVEAMFRDLDDEGEPTIHHGRVRLHEPYPGWATHEVSVILLHRLPPLPKGIFYRFVDRDLVLWDADADLIVDVLPDAISAGIATPRHCRRARLSPESEDRG